MYQISISGKSMEVQHQYVTGGLLLRWLRSMCPVQAEFTHSDGVRYRYYPNPSWPKYNGCHGPLSPHDVVDLEIDSDFVLQPVPV